MPPEVEIKKSRNEFEVSDLVNISIKNGQRNVIAPERLDERTLYILAFKDGKVVGGVGSILHYSDSRNPNSEAEIDVLTAEEPFREQGLEDLLLKRMLADLAALNIGAIRAIVEDSKIELYFRNGFRHDPQNFDYMVHNPRY